MSRGMAFALVLLAGCAASPPSGEDVPGAETPRPWREMVIWTDQAVDEDLSLRLARIGVDRVVFRRGNVDLSSGSPVLKLGASPPVAGDLDVGHWYFLNTGQTRLTADLGAAVWHGIASTLDRLPTEVVLEFGRIPAGAGEFVERLARQAGLRVALVVRTEEFDRPEVLAAAEAAYEVVVPLFGANDRDMRGLVSDDAVSLAARVAPLAERGIPVRAAIGLRPKTEPALDGWGDDLDPLTEAGVATVSTASDLDRAFRIERPLSWSGHELEPRDRVDIQWMDVARLDMAIREIDRLVVPRVTGWDLIPLPPPGDRQLGISRAALFQYLEGEGPAPEIEVEVDRQGRSLRVNLTNRSPFGTAVSGFGNLVELRVDEGQLVAEERGDFDRVALGTIVQGEWRPARAGEVNAVRFLENYIGPSEELSSGVVRLPTWRSDYTVTWRAVLSTGEEIGSVAE